MTRSAHSNQQITFPRIAGLLSAALGMFVLAGWTLDISWIKSVLPGTVEMKAALFGSASIFVFGRDSSADTMFRGSNSHAKRQFMPVVWPNARDTHA